MGGDGYKFCGMEVISVPVQAFSSGAVATPCPHTAACLGFANRKVYQRQVKDKEIRHTVLHIVAKLL